MTILLELHPLTLKTIFSTHTHTHTHTHTTKTNKKHTHIPHTYTHDMHVLMDTQAVNSHKEQKTHKDSSVKDEATITSTS